MAIITTGKTFGTTDAVTSVDLNNVANAATFNDPVDETSLELITSGTNIGKLQIKDAGVTKAKIENVANLRVLGNTSGSAVAPQEVEILDDDTMATATDTTLATSESIKAFAGMTPVQNGSGGGYSGGESVTLPNGLTMKFGRVAATSDGDYTVNFAEDFDNAVIFATAIANTSSREIISVQIRGTPAVGSMVVGIKDENNLTGFYWQAIGH